MANLNVTNIPAPRVPFIDERTGLMAREWYRFFLNLFVLTGSGSNPITLDELQIGPPTDSGLTELLIQINKDIQGAFVQPVVQTGTIANYNLNNSPTAGGVAYGTGPALAVSAAGTAGQVLTSTGSGAPTWTTDGGGTVTSVSVVSANGLNGTVATATTTPAITLSTTITGVLKGNGTAISAAASGTDYAPATSGTSILYGNGSGGFSNVTIGTGVAFAGGALSATGSGGTVTSVTGTAPVVSSGGNTPAISMPAATTSVNGYLTSTDWTTFNNKGSGTVTSVSGTTGHITSTGGATPVIDLASGVATPGTTGSATLIPVVTIDTYGRVTSITTAANPQGTVTSVTGTAPVVSSGGATPAISMAAATSSVNGYLTSTDWSTFNSKGSGTVTSVAALTLGTTCTDLSSTVATGTTTPVITLQVPTASASNRGALSAADWTTFNNKGNGTVTSVTGTAPVVSSGGATPAISMAAATTSVSGYLTSTDWNTFNGKGSGTVTSVSVVSANGLAGTVATATTTPAITLTTSITGILKGNGTAISAAVANTDYVPLSTVLTKTADYTITNTDTWIINNKTGSSLTLTFPAASSWPGRYITVKNLQTQTVVSASSNVVPIGSTVAGTAILLGVVGNWATMVSDGTNWVIMQAAPNNILLLE